MKEVAESREKIKEGIEKRKQESDDRAKHMGLVVREKKTVADTSRKLRLSTTSEGAEAIKQAIRKASETISREFGKQEKDMEVVMDKCRKAEKDLHQRTRSAKEDAHEVSSAASQIKEAKSARDLANRAERIAKDDARFTDDRMKRQEDDRKRSQRRQGQQKEELRNIRLNW